MAESHTVARTFLKGFAAKLDAQAAGLVVYDKHEDLARQVRSQKIASAQEVSTHTDFYMIVRPDGAADPIIEEALRSIEDYWPAFATALRTPGVALSLIHI